MWAIMRATASRAGADVLGRVGAPMQSSGSRRDRFTCNRREGDVLRSQPARGGTRHGRRHLSRGVDRPLKALHPAEGATDHREEPLDAEVRDQAAVNRHEVRHREQREFKPVGLARGRIDGAWPGGARHPPSRFEQMTKYRSVSTGFPGPMRLSHQPGRLAPSWRPAALASPVKAWQM